MRIILSENLDDIERWVFPDVNDEAAGTVRAEKVITTHEAPATPVTEENVQVDYDNSNVERSQQDGFNDGYREGLKKAKEEAFAAAKAEAEKKYQNEWRESLEQINKLLKNLSEPMSIIDDEVEKSLTNLAIKLAERLFYNEISVKPEQVLTIVRKASAYLPTNAIDVTLQVNPEDENIIREILKDDSFKNIKSDPKLKRGDCIFKVDRAEIDATFEKRLDNITHQVFSDVSE